MSDPLRWQDVWIEICETRHLLLRVVQDIDFENDHTHYGYESSCDACQAYAKLKELGVI